MSVSIKEASKVSSFIKGSSILVLSNVCLKAINFFLLPLYTGNLTPEMIGVSDSITTMTGILIPLLTMGLDSAFSAFYYEKNDSNRAEKVFSTLTWVFWGIGCIPLLMLFLGDIISNILFHSPNYSYIIRIALISVTFSLWHTTYALELRLKNRMFWFGLSNVLASLTMVALNILFVSILHLGESSLVLSAMFVHIESFFVLLLMVQTKPNIKWFDGMLLKSMLKFSAPMIPMTLMMWILSLSDRYILLYYCGEAEVGLYGIGLRFTNLLNVVITAVSMAYTTFAYSSKDDKDAKKNYYYIFNIETFFLMGIAFSLGLFSKEIIQLMTAQSYWVSYVTIRDLMFSQTFFAMASVVGYGIFFEKKSGYSLMAVSAGALLNIILNFILIPKYGIAAASLTTLLGYALYFGLTLYYSEKTYSCEYGQKRVISTIVILYFICYIFMETQLAIKILIWIISIMRWRSRV